MIKLDTGNTIGLKRKVDDKSRVIIPVEYLKSIGAEKEVEIFLTKDGVFVRGTNKKGVEV